MLRTYRAGGWICLVLTLGILSTGCRGGHGARRVHRAPAPPPVMNPWEGVPPAPAYDDEPEVPHKTNERPNTDTDTEAPIVIPQPQTEGTEVPEETPTVVPVPMPNIPKKEEEEEKEESLPDMEMEEEESETVPEYEPEGSTEQETDESVTEEEGVENRGVEKHESEGHQADEHEANETEGDESGNHEVSSEKSEEEGLDLTPEENSEEMELEGTEEEGEGHESHKGGASLNTFGGPNFAPIQATKSEHGFSRISVCHTIHGYNELETIDPSQLSVGQPILIYAATSDTQHQVAGKVRSKTYSFVEFRRNDGTLLQRVALGEAEETTAAHRSDFYLAHRVAIPRSLPCGDFLMRLQVHDLQERRVIEDDIPITIVASE